MNASFTIKGDQSILTIEILKRRSNDSNDTFDKNWILTHIELLIPGYKVSFNGDMQTTDIDRFLKETKQIYEKISGNTELTTLENPIHLVGKMTKTGKICWNGKTVYPIGFGAMLEFEFESDQSYLPVLIAELEKVLNVYPVI